MPRVKTSVVGRAPRKHVSTETKNKVWYVPMFNSNNDKCKMDCLSRFMSIALKAKVKSIHISNPLWCEAGKLTRYEESDIHLSCNDFSDEVELKSFFEAVLKSKVGCVMEVVLENKHLAQFDVYLTGHIINVIERISGPNETTLMCFKLQDLLKG